MLFIWTLVKLENESHIFALQPFYQSTNVSGSKILNTEHFSSKTQILLNVQGIFLTNTGHHGE